MPIKIEYPHVCKNASEFEIIKKVEVQFGEEYNSPKCFPVVIIDVNYFYNKNGNDEIIFSYLYKDELENIIKQFPKF